MTTDHEASTNHTIAAIFRDTADLLEAQGAQVFRIRAYRKGADTLDRCRDVRELRSEGALEALPGIGASLAAAIDEYLHTGHCRTLDRLRGYLAPEDLFCKIPGIGEMLAEKIHTHLHAETLEDLEAAAHDGSLATVPGIGPAKAQEVAEHLMMRLNVSPRKGSRARSDRHRVGKGDMPTLATLLEIDRDYRCRMEELSLPLVAPKRFNPLHAAWLPVYHPVRDGWSFSVMLSNSAMAHKLGKTHDWVIIVAERDGHEEQFTVVTEYHGDLRGMRVVRGYSDECRKMYASPLPGAQEAVHRLAESL